MKAIFPGSFDPFTLGHKELVIKGLNIFSSVTIAIGTNSTKKRYFDLDLMIEKIKNCFDVHQHIDVCSYEGLTVDLADKLEAKFIIRGLRNTHDFDYENSIAQINKLLNPQIETVFFNASTAVSSISSTIVREIHKNNRTVDQFLPYKL